ncbi:MAG: molybdopterin molybdotransferase MoeA [candidate division Zixibacteria bacterium]|nr:molybdopterin molybdotransferase MoeA [candidate division Zixibacteria bacterium]
MISVEKAVQIVLDTINVLKPEKVQILYARGRVLAEDVISNEDLPLFDYASMTGYALRAIDICKASSRNPVPIHLDGDITIGQKWETPLKPRHTVRINMGAPLPAEADSVLPEEHAVRDSSKKVLIYKPARVGYNIRMKGEDIPKGTLVIPRGKKISATDIGILSVMGLAEVDCFRVPRVSFLTAGNGIVDVKAPLQDGMIRSSNRYTLHSQLAEYGAEPFDLGLVKKDKKEITEKINDGVKYDLFINSVGPSFEDFSFIKRMLEQIGMDIKFWKVAIKPTTPIIFGTCNNTPIFSLSGNPFSFFLSLEQFIRPALMKMMGSQIIKRAEVNATLTKDLKSDSRSTSYMRGTVVLTDEGFSVTPDFKKSSSIRAFASANGLIVMPDSINYLKAGSKVKVQILAEPKNGN